MKRWLKRIGLGLVALVGVILWAVVAAIVFLETDTGGRFLRDKVVTKANATLSGSLEVGSVDFYGASLVLHDVTLKDPDGEVVADVDELRVKLGLGALVKRTVHVEEIALVRPELHVVKDENGTNLQAALEPREPEEKKPKKEGNGKLPVDIVLDAFTIEDGLLSYEQNTGTQPLSVTLKDLDTHANVSATKRGDLLDAGLELTGMLTEPTDGAVKVTLKAHGEGDDRTVDVDVDAADARLVAHAELNGTENLTVDVKKAEAPPELVRAFSPSYPLQATVGATAHVEKKGSDVRGNAHVTAGSGTIDAKGQVNLDTFISEGVHVAAKDLDLSELVEDGPDSAIAFEVDAKGGGKSADDLTGTFAMNAPPSKIDGSQFGPIRIDASADDGYLTLRTLDAQVPGLAMTARGEGDKDNVHVFGRLAAKDLGLFGRTLGKLAGPQGLPVSGNGALAFEVKGPIKAPGVTVNGNFPALAYAQNRIQDLRLRAQLPDVKQPLAGDADVQVSATRVTASGKELVCPRLGLTMKDGALALNAGTRGFATIDLSAKGAVDPDRQGLSLSAMTLRYPEATWKLEKPAKVRLEKEKLAVKDFALRSGEQRLEVDATKTKTRIDAALNVVALKLQQLPHAFVDPKLGLKGVLSVDAKANGKLAQPDVVAKVTLQDGRVKQYDGIALSLDASWKDQRAEGKLNATAVGLKARGEFDVPVAALKAGRAEKVRADVVVEDASIEKLLAQLDKQNVHVTGVAGATITLSGTARDPKLVAELHGRNVVYEQQPPMDLDVAAKSADDGKLVARIDAKTLGRPSFVAIDTPWTLGRLIRKPPTAEQALHAAIAVKGKIDRFPLPVALGQEKGKAIRPTTAPQQGTGGSGPPTSPKDENKYALLDGTIDVRGTPLMPKGDAELTLKNIRSTADQPPMQAWVKLGLQAKTQHLQFKVDQGASTLAKADAKLNAAIAQLRKPRALAKAPFDVEATWGPVSIMDLQQLVPPSPNPEKDPPPLLTGLLRGTLKASGTASDPNVQLETSVHGLGATTNATLGDVVIKYAYANAKDDLTADLLSGKGGTMTLHASTPLDLSLPAVQKGLPWRRAPITASLDANHFDPAFLAGVSPKLLGIGGSIDAKVAVGGHLSLPHVNGKLEWKDGTLALAGSGSYQQIHVLVHGDENKVVLEDASAHAGRGTAQLVGTFTRAGEAVNLEVKSTLKEFPAIAEDQLAATISMDATAKGTASLALIDIPEVKVSEAHIELPVTSKKKLEKLKPPEDVAFLVNGKPLEKPGQKKAAKKQQAESGVGGAGGAGTGSSGDQASASASTREIRAVINAPKNLWVKGKDLNMEIGLSENFRVQMVDQPMVFGDVNVIRGRLDVMGRRFDFDRQQYPSKVTLTGPATEPRVDVAPTYENKREEVKVTLRITGSPGNIQIHPTSDPPMSETEIYTLIATGRRSLKPGTGSAGGGNPAASLLGSLAAAQLKKGIEAALPLDVLSIEPGDKGIGGTRVEAGTYLSDRLYLGVESTIGAQRNQKENQNEMRLEYQLWKRFMLDLDYGDAAKGTGDLMWKKTY